MKFLGVSTFIGTFSADDSLRRGVYQPIKSYNIEDAREYMIERHGKSWKAIYSLEQYHKEQRENYLRFGKPLQWIGVEEH